MNIDILMATYNGEKYIENQLLSLLMQTHKKWRLLIHDDGSTDKTVAIIKKFQEQDSRIKLVEDNICYHDPAYNFLHLLKYSTSDYIMFCDQDDIWLENKLEDSLIAIKNRDNTKPQAVYSNSFVYDEKNGKIEGDASLALPRTLNQLLFLNAGIQGCAIIFNRCLKNKCIDIPDSVAMHDHLVCLIAVTFGELTYLNKRLMLYRRHEETITGSTVGKKVDKIFSFLDNNKSLLDKKHYDAVVSFYKKFMDQIMIPERNLFEAYMLFPKQNKIQNICSMFRNRFIIFDNQLILFFKIILRKTINNE